MRLCPGRIVAAAVVALAGWSASAAAQQSSADSALAAACAADGGVADGILLVEFGPEISADQRGAIAGSVGGRLLGPGSDGAGDYLVLPADGRPALDAAADRLILLTGVQSVGGAVCPPPPQPVDTAAGDSARADSAARLGAGGGAGAPRDSAGAP